MIAAPSVAFLIEVVEMADFPGVLTLETEQIEHSKAALANENCRKKLQIVLEQAITVPKGSRKIPSER